MFTGIVQTRGTVQSIQHGSTVVHLVLDAPDLARPIPHGASVCVSGVCLTVTRSDPNLVHFDVIPETIRQSTLGELSTGNRVNLERSLLASDRLDGHVVQGHVDGIGIVKNLQKNNSGHVITLSVDESLMPFIIPKGSVALDGISLTIAHVHENTFKVAVIPTTWAVTTLGSLRIGNRVNIETDILARTVITTMNRWRDSAGSPALTLEKLREHGW